MKDKAVQSAAGGASSGWGMPGWWVTLWLLRLNAVSQSASRCKIPISSAITERPANNQAGNSPCLAVDFRLPHVARAGSRIIVRQVLAFRPDAARRHAVSKGAASAH